MKRLKIGDLCELQNGRAFKQSEWQDHGHPIIRIQNLSDPQKGFNYAADGYPSKFWVDRGDILFSWSGTPGTSFGCFRWNGQPGWLNQHIFNMRLKNPEQIDGDYFILAINGVMREIINQAHGGVGLKHITKAKLLNVEVPFPPLEEQKRIAKILDAADALRAKRRESLAQLDALLQSTFLDLFGDPDANGWEWSSVENVAEERKGAIRTGPFGSQLLHSEFVDSGVPVLGIDNVVSNGFRDGKPRFITDDKYEKLKRYTVKPGDVLITIMGTCGRCAIVPDGLGLAINTKHLCCISLNKEACLPEFMHAYFLLHPIARRYLEDNAKGAIMSGLNMGIIKALPIPLPPIELQIKFSNFVKYLKKKKGKLLEHDKELTGLFSTLQQKAFSGEL